MAALPPLKLLDYKVLDLSIKSDVSFSGTPEQDREGKWEVRVQHWPLPSQTEPPLQFTVALDISVAPAEGKPCPYTLALRLAGRFAIDSEYPEEKRAALLAVTAPSILYSAARELLLSVTGRALWGPYMLPTVRFMPKAPPAEKTALPEGQAAQEGQVATTPTSVEKVWGRGGGAAKSSVRA